MKQVNIKCPYCGSRAFLRPASVIHDSKYRQPGDEVYVCARYPACDSYVSAHRHNHLPMGTLADRSLRHKRMKAHAVFRQLWEKGFMTKPAAYRWLQVQMDLPPEETHIARFSDWRCDQVIGLCGRFLSASARAA